MKETQELVKSIGEVAEKAFQIYTHSEREKVAEVAGEIRCVTAVEYVKKV